MRLRNMGDLARHLAARQRRALLADDDARERRDEAEQRAKRVVLPEPFGPSRQRISAGRREVDSPTTTSRPTIADRSAGGLMSATPAMTACRAPAARRRPGAPTTAVRMPSGTSMSAMVRASMSTPTMKAAPRTRRPATAGRSAGRPGSGAICGTISPTQPMTPEIATTLAVISVAAAMTRRAGGRPRRRASALRRRRATGCRSASEAPRAAEGRSGDRHDGEQGRCCGRSARLPSSQKVIAGNWS